MDDDAGRGLRTRLLVGVLAVLLVAVVATAVVLLLDRRPDRAGTPDLARPADVGVAGWDDPPADDAVAAVVAARRATTTYFTVDHRTAARDLDAMRALGTDAFAESYDGDAGALARRVTRARLRLTAALVPDGTATEYLTADLARVLVAVDVTTTAPSGRRTAPYRTRVALDLVDGEWLVASLAEVG